MGFDLNKSIRSFQPIITPDAPRRGLKGRFVHGRRKSQLCYEDGVVEKWAHQVAKIKYE